MARNDPRRVWAKYRGTCASCGTVINRGCRAIYWPITRTMQCLDCGEDGYRQAQASFEDERAYNYTG